MQKQHKSLASSPASLWSNWPFLPARLLIADCHEWLWSIDSLLTSWGSKCEQLHVVNDDAASACTVTWFYENPITFQFQAPC